MALDSLKSAIKRVGSMVSRRKQRQLTSTAIMELLKLDPDIDAVDASLAAAEATGVDPSPELFRARRMRDAVVRHKKKAARKKVAMKKAAKKKVAKKKLAQKKAAKKK